MALVTCHTDGCANAGIAIELATTYTDDEGVHSVDAVECGVCGQPITDITEGAES